MNRRFFLRTIWRLLTVALIVGLTIVTTEFIVPYLDRHLPVFPIVLIVYVLIAYVLIPFVVRFWRVVIKPDHIPRYVTTPDGWAADPVNIAIVAKNKRHFKKAMVSAGWYQADKLTIRNSLHEAYALIFDTAYPNAPFSALYLFGRKFDLGFQIPYTSTLSPRKRHHVRFWLLKHAPRTDKKDHFSYWFERFKNVIGRKKIIWIGAAIDDINITGFRWRSLQITHKNSADHTLERDYIVQTLEDHGLVKSITDIKDGEPFKMRSQNLGVTFITDGYIRVVTLK